MARRKSGLLVGIFRVKAIQGYLRWEATPPHCSFCHIAEKRFSLLRFPRPGKAVVCSELSSFADIIASSGLSVLRGTAYGGRLYHADSAVAYCSHSRRGFGRRIISGKAEDESAKLGEEPISSFNAGVKYSVLRINSDGTFESQILSTSEFGIHPRDMELLTGSIFIPKRSAIAVRNDKVLVRMENVRALVCKNYCLLFDAHYPRKGPYKHAKGKSDVGSAQQSSDSLYKPREAFGLFMAQYVKQLPSQLQEPMPFHLRIIECLLDDTSKFFHQKVERLKVVVERMLEELTNDVDMGGLQRLLPLKRALTEVEHDVHDTHEALDQIIGSDDMLKALCFEGEEALHISEGIGDPQLSRIRQTTANTLVTYLREIDDAGGALEELRKDMDSAQEVWELGLDTIRNRIIRMNLFISVATVSFNLATVPASFFGMNLRSGLEDHPEMFYFAVGTISATALALGLVLTCISLVWPNVRNKRRAQEFAALKDFLQHIDDMDDIFQEAVNQGGGSRISQQEFARIVQSHSSARFIQQRELDLMYQMFDSNCNSLLEGSEWNGIPHRRIRQKIPYF